MSEFKGSVHFELTIPEPWPPREDIYFYKGSFEGSSVKVLLRSDATLEFSCSKNDSSCSLRTPVIQMPNLASLSVAFSWGGTNGSTVAINGLLFKENSVFNEPVDIRSRNHKPTRLRDQLDVKPLIDLPVEEERLIGSVYEMQEKILRQDRNSLLGASANLRLILLDRNPLLHKVNKLHRCKVRFLVVLSAPSNIKIRTAFSFKNLAPLFAADSEMHELKLDQFLSTPVVCGEDQKFTVKDVIDVCANSKGGVHFGDPKPGSQSEICQLDRFYQPALIDASLHALGNFSWCVIQALNPLVQKICER